MKKLILTIFMVFITIINLSAQQGKRERLKAYKTAYITEHLDLTPQEAEKFWPIYNAYEKQIYKLKVLNIKDQRKQIVDVRIIAATNKDLKKEISKAKFREDLYHRLAVILIHVPSLNERKEDIPMLIDHFSKNIAEQHGNSQKPFDEDAIKLLQEYDWTGNVRELRNIVERLLILGGDEISENDVKLFASK